MTSFKQHIENLFKNNTKFSDSDGNLDIPNIVDAIDKIDIELIKFLKDDEKAKENFFIKVDDVYILEQNKLIDFFTQNDYMKNGSFTSYTNKIGLIKKDNFIKKFDDVVLAFPHKDCVLEAGQTKDDDKSKEVFYNEIIASDEIDRLFEPKVLTNIKRYSKDGVEENPTIKDDDNLIIKGNNLIALHSLKKKYAGKVKLIYIDPPFNTGNDSFKYNDNFNHSTWLTFMKNRLEVAKDFLSDDGNIFIHIDINQSHYLKILCDELFGKANFVEELIWSYGSASGGRAAGAKPVNIHDYILHYAKDYSNRKQIKTYTQYSEKYIKDWFKYTDDDGRIYQKRMRGKDIDGNSIWAKQYLDESKGIPLTTVWTDIKQVYADPRAYKESQSKYTELEKEFKGGQKPEALIKRIIEMCTYENDLILDYHLGTGTTAVTAHKMKRRYIGIEQMAYIKDFTVNRLIDTINGNEKGISKAVEWKGGGDFIYAELKKIDNFKDTKIKPLNKNMQYLPISEIEDEDYKISKEEIAINKAFYGFENE